MTVKQFIDMLFEQWIPIYIYSGGYQDIEKITTLEKLLKEYGNRKVISFDPNIVPIDIILESEGKS